jgi:hypothetical protein
VSGRPPIGFVKEEAERGGIRAYAVWTGLTHRGRVERFPGEYDYLDYWMAFRPGGAPVVCAACGRARHFRTRREAAVALAA